MAEPTDLDVPSDPPLRLFAPEEASALVPTLESIFLRMDADLVRMKEVRELLEDQEAYWGPELVDATDAERARHLRLVADLEEIRFSVEGHIEEIRRLGGELKDPHLGLVDFYAWIEGDLVYLCWQRGEPKVAHWHTLEAGYAGRKPLPPGVRAGSAH